MKSIRNFEGIYSVTSCGKVYSHRNKLFLKTGLGKNGYEQVKLSKHGKKTTLKVHRLVALAYLGNPEDLPLVLHGKEGKTVNTVENLRWGTYSDNRKDAELFNERPTEFIKGSGHGNSKLTDKQVLRIYDLAHNSDLTQKQIGDNFNVSYACVSNIKRGIQWNHVTKHK